MEYVLTSAQMKQCDMNTMEYYGMLSPVLMERAAMSVVDEIIKRFPDSATSVLIACGTGNNGGDGIAMARLLYLKGYTAWILFPGKEEKCSVEAKRQLEIARKYEIPIYTELNEELKRADVVADALFGIGLCRDIGGIYFNLIQELNDLSGYKIAVDISSGISADNGACMGIAFRADLTVTFGFAKIGQLLYPGADYTGELQVKDIGIDKKSLLDIKPECVVMNSDDYKLFPVRRAHSNKGSYGKVLVIAGSVNMAGAAILAGKAAYRSGVGLVKVVTAEANRVILQSQLPEAILSTYDENAVMQDYMEEQLSWADSIVVGPGLGTSPCAEEIVRTVLSCAMVPVILDADGLNIVAKHMEWLELADCPVIVTPHLGEMSRLIETPISEIQKDLVNISSEFAKKHGVVVVLKDARSIISTMFGMNYINVTGNHGMATGGSGDVLSGIIGGLCAQKMDIAHVAACGAMLHGMAGDYAAKKCSPTSMLAMDIVDGIGEFYKNLK